MTNTETPIDIKTARERAITKIAERELAEMRAAEQAQRDAAQRQREDEERRARVADLDKERARIDSELDALQRTAGEQLGALVSTMRTIEQASARFVGLGDQKRALTGERLRWSEDRLSPEVRRFVRGAAQTLRASGVTVDRFCRWLDREELRFSR